MSGIRITRGKVQAGQIGVIGGTATGTSNAATLNAGAGVITTESASTTAGNTFTLTLTNNHIAAADIVLVSVTTGGTGSPAVTKVTPAAGSVVIVIQNVHGSTAFNNTLKISFVVIKQ